jgi:hypothetical protein
LTELAEIFFRALQLKRAQYAESLDIRHSMNSTEVFEDLQ